jgi:hypothetical protein
MQRRDLAARKLRLGRGHAAGQNSFSKSSAETWCNRRANYVHQQWTAPPIATLWAERTAIAPVT